MRRCERIIAKGAGHFVRVGLADGQAAATYEYGPFGEVIRETGARGNPFGFSTKYWDETGLLYYGYRYYNASMGRWVSRDPLEEEGSQGK